MRYVNVLKKLIEGFRTNKERLLMWVYLTKQINKQFTNSYLSKFVQAIPMVFPRDLNKTILQCLKNENFILDQN